MLLHFDLFSDCLQLNHDYNTGPNIAGAYFSGISSLYQCQLICLNNPKCLTFDIVHSPLACVLKSGGYAYAVSSPNYDAGTRVCEGKYFQFLTEIK